MVMSNHHLGDQGSHRSGVPGAQGGGGGLRGPEVGWFLDLAEQREVAWRRRQ